MVYATMNTDQLKVGSCQYTALSILSHMVKKFLNLQDEEKALLFSLRNFK